MRFGMGLSSMHVSRPDRRDRLLLISALAIAMLSLLVVCPRNNLAVQVP